MLQQEGLFEVPFSERSQELAAQHGYAAITDVSDYYNQIYLHRLQNAIESASPENKSIADDIENFLLSLNNKASQGVPVGPAASVIMAEAVMTDIDNFITQCNVKHTRYVDDIRMFADSEEVLASALEKLTLYLYENHRLTLVSDKTKILTSEDFVDNHLHNPYLDDKDEIMEKLDNISPYGAESDEEIAEEDVGQTLIDALGGIVGYEYIDLGLARSIIRTARRNKVVELITPALENFEYLAPVTPDLFLYLQEVLSPLTHERIRIGLEEICDSHQSKCALVRHWIEHFISGSKAMLDSAKLRAFVYQGQSWENRARAAITLGDIAWVRTQKANIYNVGSRARRSIINAARVLPTDERENWLKLVAQNAALPLERWVANWVKDTA